MLHDTTMYSHILGVLEGECRGQCFAPSDTQTNSLKTTSYILVYMSRSRSIFFVTSLDHRHVNRVHIQSFHFTYNTYLV